MNIAVIQQGARMHYAVPRIFQEAGILGCLFTDIVGNVGLPAIAKSIWPTALQPTAAKSLFARIPHGIPREKIHTYPWIGAQYFYRYQRSKSLAETVAAGMDLNDKFAQRVLRDLGTEFDSLYILGPMVSVAREAKRRGIRVIVEQANAPAPVITRILLEESRQFPDVAHDEYDSDAWLRFAAREKEEWDYADLVVCGSQFVLDGIREVGGPVDRTKVVPYGVDQQAVSREKREFKHDGSFNVVFVGRVDIRKGAHHLLQAARFLEKENVKVRFVGPVQLSESTVASKPPNVEFVGRLSRSQVVDQYRWAHAFCLPSLCEGSATVTYEAMAMGLPVIATHNTGSIVREGVNGLIVPIRDPKAIAAAIIQCRALLASEKGHFPDNRGDPPPYSFGAYRQRLLEAVTSLA